MLYVYLNDELQIICPVEAKTAAEAAELVWDRTKITVDPDELYPVATRDDMGLVLDHIGDVLGQSIA